MADSDHRARQGYGWERDRDVERWSDDPRFGQAWGRNYSEPFERSRRQNDWRRDEASYWRNRRPDERRNFDRLSRDAYRNSEDELDLGWREQERFRGYGQADLGWRNVPGSYSPPDHDRRYYSRRSSGWPDYRVSQEDYRYGSPRRDWRGGSGDRSNERGFWDRASDEVASWFGDRDAESRRQTDEWRGEHRGKGPRGYTRSDERIREDVSDALTDDPYIDASNIDVIVQNGDVTLNGTVDNRLAKRRAEDCSERISGARNVQNNLRVSEHSYSAQTAATGPVGASAAGRQKL